MRPKKPIQEEKQDSVLVKAATTIGKAAGKVVRLIRPDKGAPDPAPRKRTPASRKTQSTVRKRVVAKKTARKAKKAVRSTTQ